MHARLAKAAHDEIERARHLGSATLLPDEDVAALIEGAADVARGRAAITAAAELALQAERLTPEGDVARRTSRACTSALLFHQTGDISTATSVVRRVLDDLDPGPSRARCLATLAEVLGGDPAGAADALNEALQQPGLTPEFEDEVRYVRGLLRVNLGDFALSAAEVTELEARAEAAGRTDLARRCRAHLAFLDLAMGTPPVRSSAWRRMVQEAASFELCYDHPDLCCAWEAMAREDHRRALDLMDGLMERARLAGNVELWASIAGHRCEVLLRRGDIAEACGLADEVGRILADGRHDEFWLSIRGVALAWSGRLDEARVDASGALTMARHDGNRLFEAYALHALGFVELSDGRTDVAAAICQDLLSLMRSNGWRHPSLVVWQGNAVEALVSTGRRAEATSIVEELEAMADGYELATSVALARRCRALLLEDEGDLDRALDALDESVRLSEPLNIPLEHARTLLIRGVVHRRSRQKALSRDDLRRARDLFAGCGATVWAARAERELERSAAVPTGAELTGSERAVAQMAASGSTNREIAASLYLSEKTVEAVLTRVYRKLAVRSRTQLGQHPELTGPARGERRDFPDSSSSTRS
jgi:ATP/maltotriose-dependent transcriptional regulator MalT